MTKRAINVLIDFDNLENNLYHGAGICYRAKPFHRNRRPDIVLFVNGIPIVVIENKKAATDVFEGSASPSATKA